MQTYNFCFIEKAIKKMKDFVDTEEMIETFSVSSI
jgi:hypothetical protein